MSCNGGESDGVEAKKTYDLRKIEVVNTSSQGLLPCGKALSAF